MYELELNPVDISSPKRKDYRDGRAISDWYGFYAGYSVNFVKDVIEYCSPCKNGLIVDPWNGAGTTTTVASHMNLKSFGSDLNPVMAIISRARTASNINIKKLQRRIEASWKKSTDSSHLKLPLFSNQTSSAIYRLRKMIVGDSFNVIVSMTEEDCVLLTALFLMTRQLAVPFQGSNPTWWKSDYSEPINLNCEEVLQLYKSTLFDLISSIECSLNKFDDTKLKPEIATASASNIPLDKDSAELVVTSPPYLTRIDYVKLMRYELAILYGLDKKNDELRQKMMGSVMGGSMPAYANGWGKEAKASLDHAISAASAIQRGDGSYYAGTIARYFDHLFNALIQINSIVKSSGQIVIVTQGSRHRGRVIDLPVVVQEMGKNLGWEIFRAIAWQSKDLGLINSKSIKYGNYTINETSILMRKP